jgi:hypothetical protein
MVSCPPLSTCSMSGNGIYNTFTLSNYPISDATLLCANDTNILLYIVKEDVSSRSLQPTLLPNVR